MGRLGIVEIVCMNANVVPHSHSVIGWLADRDVFFAFRKCLAMTCRAWHCMQWTSFYDMLGCHTPINTLST